MKKVMFVVLFAVLFISACASKQTPVQTQSVGAAPTADTADNADNFVVADHFKISEGNSPQPVKFSFISDRFQSYFYGKTEAVKSAAIPNSHHDLRVTAMDNEIIAALGGEAKAETSLYGIYELLKLQPNGEAGTLLTNGYANMFYVRDANYSELLAVFVRWDGGGWRVTMPRWFPVVWGVAGNRVFSR